MRTARRFVFLEITDPKIGSLLRRMQWILSGDEPQQRVRLTLRGPYRGEVPREALDNLRTKLRGAVLRIGGVGRFENRKEEVVFLHVKDIPNLPEVWWKPSFPKKKGHDRVPHISLYRGRDAQFADSVAGFLKKEKLNLRCDKYELTVHESGLQQQQMLLFPGGMGSIDFMEPMSGVFDEKTADLLERLRRLVDEYRSSPGGRLADIDDRMNAVTLPSALTASAAAADDWW